LKVLKQNLLLLDEWEKNLEDGLIQEKEFLTKTTAESLRLTLKSTVDLVLFSRRLWFYLCFDFKTKPR